MGLRRYGSHQHGAGQSICAVSRNAGCKWGTGGVQGSGQSAGYLQAGGCHGADRAPE